MSSPKNRRRPDEPQIVKIYYKKLFILTGGITLALGIIVLGILHFYHNNYAEIADQKCPALKNSIFAFVQNMASVLLFSGVLDLAIGGLIPRLFVLMMRNDEAICFGHLFMGMFGQTLKFATYSAMIAFNVYGTVVLVRAHQAGAVTTESNFCHPVILNLARSLNGIIYFSLVALIVLMVFQCIKMCRKNETIEETTVMVRSMINPYNPLIDPELEEPYEPYSYDDGEFDNFDEYSNLELDEVEDPEDPEDLEDPEDPEDNENPESPEEEEDVYEEEELDEEEENDY